VPSIKHFDAGYGESTLIRNVNLTLEPGQINCLMGRNGVRKSTFMKRTMMKYGILDSLKWRYLESLFLLIARRHKMDLV
jgi:urea transport system ATP-binding protein